MKNFKKVSSSFILLLYIFSLLTESFAYGIQTPSETMVEGVTLPQLQVVFDQSEVSIGDSIGVEISYDGEFGYISNFNLNMKDSVKGLTEYFHVNQTAEGGYQSILHIDAMKLSGNYEVDSISFMMDEVFYIVHNEKFYDAEPHQQTFDSGFSIVGTYGDVRPDYEIQLSSKEAVPGEMVTLDLFVNTSSFNAEVDKVFIEYNQAGRFAEIEMDKIESGHFQFTKEVNQYTRDGLYSLNRIRFQFPEFQVYIADGYNQRFGTTEDLSVGSFSVSGTVPDYDAPVLEEIVIEREIATPDSPGIVRIRALDESGLSHGRISLGREWNSRVIELVEDQGDLVGYFSPEQHESSGIYEFKSLYMEDHNGNSINYSDITDEESYGEKIDLSPYFFSVHGTYDDSVIFTVSSQKIEDGGQSSIHIQLIDTDNYVKYDSVMLSYMNPEMSEGYQVELLPVSDSVFEGYLNITPTMISGEYSLQYAQFGQMMDQWINYKTIYHNGSHPNEQLTADLSFGNILVEGTLGGVVPSISFTSDKDFYGPSDHLDLELHLNDDRFAPQNINVQFVNKNDLDWSEHITFFLNEVTQTYETNWNPIVSQMKNGAYTVKSFNFNDQDAYFSFNNRIYSDYGVQFESDETIYTVEGTLAGWIPEFTVKALPVEATSGDVIEIKVHVLSDEIEFDSIRIGYMSDEMNWKGYDTEKISANEFIFKLPVHEYMNSMKYELNSIQFNGNYYNIHVSDMTEYSGWNSRDLSGGDFKIVGTPGDNEKPTLIDVIMPTHVYVNSSVLVKVIAEDNLAGIESGSIEWLLDGEYYSYTQLFEKDGFLQGNLYTPQERNRNLSISRVSLMDKAGNNITYYNPEYTTGYQDEVPMPEIKHSFILEELLYTDKINIFQMKNTYKTDDYKDIRFDLPLDEPVVSLRPVYVTPEGYEITQHAYRSSGNTFRLGEYIFYGMTPGTYTLKSIRIEKADGTYSLYHGLSSEEGYMDLSAGDYVVEGTQGDQGNPVLEEIITSNLFVKQNDNQIFKIRTSDDVSGVRNGELSIRNLTTNEVFTVDLNRNSPGILEGYFNLYGKKNGDFAVIKVMLWDYADNEAIYVNEQYTTETGIPYDFTSAGFKYYHSSMDKEAPVYISASLQKKEVAFNESFQYYVEVEDDSNQIGEMYIILEDENGNEIIVKDTQVFNTGSFKPRGMMSRIYLEQNLSDFAPGQVRVKGIIISDGIHRTVVYDDRFSNEWVGDADRLMQKDLSHLDMYIKEPMVNDVSDYIANISIQKNNLSKNEESMITVTPGTGVSQVEFMSLFYTSPYSHDDVTVVNLIRNEAGQYVGTITAPYSEGSYSAKFLRVVTRSRTIDLYDKRFPLSENIIDLSALDIKVANVESEDPIVDIDPAVFNNLTVQSGVFTGNDRVEVNFGVDFEKLNVDWAQITFRVNGILDYRPHLFTHTSKSYYRVGSFDAPGEYTIDEIFVYTRDNFVRIRNSMYYPDESDMLFENGFTVTGTTTDYDPPIFKGISVDRNVVEYGSVVNFTVDAEDAVSGLSYGHLHMSDGISDSKESIFLYPDAFGNLQGQWVIEEGLTPVEWRPESIEIYDRNGNGNMINNAMSYVASWHNNYNMESVHIQITSGSLNDTSAPVINSIEYVMNQNRSFAKIDLEEESGIDWLKLEYAKDNQRVTMNRPVFYHDGYYYMEMYFPEQFEGGIYTLISASIQDSVGNSITYFNTKDGLGVNSKDFTMARYELIRETEVGAVFVEDISINGYEITNEKPSQMTVSLTGVKHDYQYAVAEFIHKETGNYAVFETFEIKDGKFTFDIFNYPGTKSGEYVLDTIYLSGYSPSNMLIFSNSRSSSELNHHIAYDLSGFTIFMGTLDENPVISSITDFRIYNKNNEEADDNKKFSRGETAVVEISLNHDVSIDTVHMVLYKFGKSIGMNLTMEKIESGVYRGEFTFSEFYNDGDYEISDVGMYLPETREYISIHKYDNNSHVNLMKWGITLDGFGVDYLAPMLQSITVNKSELGIHDELVFTIRARDDLSGINQIYGEIRGVFSGESYYLPTYEIEEGLYEIRIPAVILKNDYYKLNNLRITDFAGNEKSYYNEHITDQWNGIKKDWSDLDFKVNVIPLAIESIGITNNPNKSSYYIGEAIDLSGLEVTGYYNDGSTRIEEVTMENITGFDSSQAKAGQVVTVNVNGKTATFTVDIIAIVLESIEITKQPDKLSYIVGEELDLSGLEVTGIYSNGEKKIETITMGNIKGFDSSVQNLGQLVEITVDGKKTQFEVDIVEKLKVLYRTHVQSYGWQNFVSDGMLSGTIGKAKRLEAIEIKIEGNADLGVKYSTHVQKIGWQNYVENGVLSGTEGRALRLEAIKIELTGAEADQYDIYYRVHAEKFGWMGWAKNGQAAGTAGYAYRLEAIEINIVEKGENPYPVNISAYRDKNTVKNISYRTHVQSIGWQDFVSDGVMSGTEGRKLRLEGIEISLGKHLPTGSVEYSTHVQSIGWKDNVIDGAMSGTEGRALRLEAIRINLTGEISRQYDIYYRVHSEKIGWMGWAKNGESAGTAGYAYRLEGIEIRLVEKGATAPGSTQDHFRIR